VGYTWVTVIDGIRFKFNDLISLYTQNDSERKRFVVLGYFNQKIFLNFKFDKYCLKNLTLNGCKKKKIYV